MNTLKLAPPKIQQFALTILSILAFSFMPIKASSARVDFHPENIREVNVDMLFTAALKTQGGALPQLIDNNLTKWLIIVPKELIDAIKFDESTTLRTTPLTFLHKHPILVTAENTGPGRFFTHLNFALNPHRYPQAPADGNITNTHTVAYKLETPFSCLKLTADRTLPDTEIYLIRAVGVDRATDYSPSIPTSEIARTYRNISTVHSLEKLVLQLKVRELASELLGSCAAHKRLQHSIRTGESMANSAFIRGTATGAVSIIFCYYLLQTLSLLYTADL